MKLRVLLLILVIMALGCNRQETIPPRPPPPPANPCDSNLEVTFSPPLTSVGDLKEVAYERMRTSGEPVPPGRYYFSAYYVPGYEAEGRYFLLRPEHFPMNSMCLPRPGPHAMSLHTGALVGRNGVRFGDERELDRFVESPKGSGNYVAAPPSKIRPPQ